MKHLRIFLIMAVFAGFALVNVWAAGVKVIANPSVGATSVSAGDLRSVFLQDKD
jgi:hypothetical protein